MQCHRFEALQPIFSELTPLDPPTVLRSAVPWSSLRLRCGYRFEDEGIVEEMLAEVEGERGALPMVAFTAAQLWEQRDREAGYLTQEAYDQIGGVGGALAQHAEATLTEIGDDGIPIVRELFRNLVTAQGTRAARDRDELLSVFGVSGARYPATARFPTGSHGLAGGRPSAPADHAPDEAAPGAAETEGAAHVLDTLIDARLLTSYEVGNEDEAAHHRIEIVHESLLKAWPRLVRWQMQDAEGAKLRDELRAQAQLWEQHGRSVDYLWTGTAYREFQLWRERYPGGLTSLEEAYARAMTAHAERRRRRRRMAVAAAFFVLLAVLGVVGGFWRRSIAEARRAEAAKLLAIAQLQLEPDPTEALAYATASLELADTVEARVFSMKALAEAPPARVMDGLGLSGRGHVFSPNGQWLAAAGQDVDVFALRQDGTDPIRLPDHKASPQGLIQAAWFGNEILVTGHWTSGRVRLWSIPEGEVLREIDFGGPAWWQIGGDDLLAEVVEADASTGQEIFHLRSWHLPDGDTRELGTVDWTALGASSSVFEPGGSIWVYSKGNGVYHRRLPARDGERDLLVGTHANEARVTLIASEPNQVWTRDTETAELKLWDLWSSDRTPLRVLSWPGEPSEVTSFSPDPSGRWLIGTRKSRFGRLLWDLEGWPDSRALHLRRQGSWYGSQTSFDPESRWLVASTSGGDQLAFWPLPRRGPIVVDYSMDLLRPLAFSPDSQSVATVWTDGSLRLWPVPPTNGELRVLHEGEISFPVAFLSFDGTGERIAGTGYGPDLFVTSIDGGPIRKLEGFSRDHFIELPAAFSPSGNLVAAGTSFGTGIEKALRVWDLETGEVRVFDLEQTKVSESEGPDNPVDGGVAALAFADETTLYTALYGGAGIWRWDLETGAFERVRQGTGRTALWMSRDRRQMISLACGGEIFLVDCEPLWLHDLKTGEARELETFWDPGSSESWPVAFDPTLSIMVIASADGILGVGRLDDTEPHLLVGHAGPLEQVQVSGDLQWIASSGENGTLRLWPMPDLDKPPLHTLPHDELIAKLQSLTNLRAVRDEASSTGWSIDIGPFPGWAEVPEW